MEGKPGHAVGVPLQYLLTVLNVKLGVYVHLACEAF